MYSTYLLVAAIAAASVLAAVFALVLWRRHAKPTLPATPPDDTTMPVLAAPPPRYIADDEWEAHAPYPDHALHAIRTKEWASKHAPPFESNYQSYDRFSLDDVERFEPDMPPTFRRSVQQPATNVDFISYAPPNAHDLAAPSQNDVARRCPHCSSSRISTLNIGRKAGSTIGSVAGATSGMAMTLSGAEAGAVVGAIGGPLGSVFGGLAGAVIAGLLGSAAGCAAGSAVGAAIDENVLDNYRCLSCGHTFSAQHD